MRTRLARTFIAPCSTGTYPDIVLSRRRWTKLAKRATENEDGGLAVNGTKS